jgi:flagellar hook-length control protein FliK
MDLAFRTAGNSTMNGLLSVAGNSGNAKLEPKGFGGKNTQFKELLNRSQSDTAQNRIDDQDPQQSSGLRQAESPAKVAAATKSVTADTESENGETTVDQNQENVQQPVVGNDLLSMIQNLQTAMTTIQPESDPSGKAGIQPGKVISNLVQGLAQDAVAPQTGQTTDSTAPRSIPIAGQNGSPLNFQEIIGQQQSVVAGAQTELQTTPMPAVNDQQPPVMTTGEVAAELQPLGQNGQQVPTAAQSLGVPGFGRQPLGLDTAGPGRQQDAQSAAAVEETSMANTEANAQDVLPSEQEETAKTDFSTLQAVKSEQDSTTDEGGKDLSQNNPFGSMDTAKVVKEVPVQTTPKVPVAQQVSQQVLQNLDVSKPVTFTMTLSPENLGDIDVQMKYDQGKLVIDIMAVSKETQKLLGKEVNQLVRSLALQNVQVDSVHVNTAVEQTSSSNGQNSASLMNSNSEFAQQQQQNAQLRESMLRNSRIFKNLQPTSEDDVNVIIPQNLLNNGNYRVNYLI